MSDVRWEGLTHEEIYAQVHQGPGRAASADAEAAWTTVGDTIRTVNEQLTRAVKQIGVDWQGAAADAAHGGMTVMNNWANDAADNATLTMDGIAAQASGAQHVRDAMPPPVQALDKAVALAGAGSFGPRTANVGALEDKAAEDRALAVDLMNQYTSDSATHQHLMNYWTQPPSVVVETVPTGAPPGKGGRGVTLGRAAGAVAGLAPASVAADGVGGSGAAGAVPGHGVPGVAAIPGSTTGEPGETTAGGPVVGRAGTAAPVPSIPGARGAAVPGASGTAGGGAAPSDRPVVPVVPGAPLPSTGAGRPGSTLPGTGSAAPRGQLPGSELPRGGVRPIVPGVPPRPGAGASGALDAPWNAPSTRPTDGLIAGGRSGVAEPLPRGGLGGLPEGASGPEAREPAGTGARAIVGGPSDDAVAGRLVGGATAERLAPAGHGAPTSGHGILPLGGAVGRAMDQEHRRPGYLVDDTDAFADDRWFTPPVIGGDDLEVRRA